MKASDLLVHCLEREGITRVFGVPGDENADLMISLEDSPIEFVLTRHEQGAAFMAEVCDRLSGSPAVCLGTLGPGATNLITGVANANRARGARALPPRGPVLREADLHQIRRRWDSAFWPHADRGFFRLKKRIGEVLRELSIAGM